MSFSLFNTSLLPLEKIESFCLSIFSKTEREHVGGRGRGAEGEEEREF